MYGRAKGGLVIFFRGKGERSRALADEIDGVGRHGRQSRGGRGQAASTMEQ
jgi:hypothetical protein